MVSKKNKQRQKSAQAEIEEIITLAHRKYLSYLIDIDNREPAGIG